MICIVIDVRYVPGVWRGLVSLSELDSRGYELQICDRSMEILRGDMTVIRGTRRGNCFEMVGTMESTFTIVPADAPTWRVVGVDIMTGCDSVATVEICHMVVSVITQLPEQGVAGGAKLGRLDSLIRLETDGGRREHAVGDVVWGIGYVRLRTMDLGLMQ
jgi:hypothetical protein